MTSRMTLRLSAVVSAVLFTIGYSLPLMVPGGGSGVKEQDFIDFYESDTRRLAAYLMGFAFVAGALALVWFFDELRSRVANDTLSRVGYTAAVIGAGAAAAGAMIDLGPAAIQINDSEVAFVGSDIARAVSQAGLGVMVGPGVMSLALATALFSLGAKRAGLLPSWGGWAGVVVAIVMLGSVIYIPGFIFPVWVLAMGMVLRPEPSAA